MDPNDPKQLTRLCNSIDASYRKLSAYRTKRVEAIRQYVGSNYSDNGSPVPVPVNFIKLAVDVYARQLVARNPKALITTPIKALKSAAYDLELDVNQVIRELQLKKRLKRTVKEAMFSVGVMKLGIASSARGFADDPGELYAETIDPDDWVQDMTARVYEHCSYSGHRWMLRRSDALADKSFNQAVLAGLSSDDDLSEDDDARSIGSKRDATDEYSEDFIEVWDIWLPVEGVILTLLGTRGSNSIVQAKVLRVLNWEGPKTGPFKVLSFTDVPGNLMPLAPVATLRDLHDLSNELYRKMGVSAVNQKDLLAYQGEAATDAERVVSAAHMDTIKVDNPERIKELSFNGVDESSLAFGIHLHDRQNVLAGNPIGLSGGAPQADTLGQERLLHESASQTIQDMQDCVTDFTADVVRDIAWYELTNPLLDRLLSKPIPFTNREVVFRLTPERIYPLASRFLDLNFEIELYSMQPRSPMEKLAGIERLLASIVVPFQQQLAEAGEQVDVGSLLRIAARYIGVNELDDFMVSAMPPRVPTQQMRGEDPRAVVAASRQAAPQRPRPAATNRPLDPNAMVTALLRRPEVIGAN